MKNEKLIKSLIKDNLIHHKLVTGLTQTGLEAGKFHLHLYETILQIVGIELSDIEFENYFSLFDALIPIDIQDNKQLEHSTENIYHHILQLKSEKAKK